MKMCSAADIYRVRQGGVRHDLIRIAERCRVERLIFFGSRAKGTAVETSDVDLAVDGGDVDAFLSAAESDVWSLLVLDITYFDSVGSEPFASEIRDTGVLLYDRRFYMRKLDNFQACLEVLRSADFSLSVTDPIYRIGIFAQFRFAFEQAWKALQQVMRDDGVKGSESGSPRELLQLGYQTGYFSEEKTWLEMLRWHNISLYEYDEEKADALVTLIEDRFLPALDRLSENLERKVREAREAGVYAQNET